MKYTGNSFTTKAGNIITILEPTGEKKDGKIEYYYSCDVCSKDEELFPEKYFKIYRIDQLRKGTIPCGCRSPYYWKDWQYEIKVKRSLSDKSASFLGWTGKFKGNNTKVLLLNRYTGEISSSRTVAQILSGKGCPFEGVRLRNTSKMNNYQEMLDRFIDTGKFREGTIFGKSDRVDSSGSKIYWKYWCPVCSKDEYTENGLCSGVFEGVASDLSKGQLSCRCGNFYWTEEQRKYQINKTLKESGSEFIQWCCAYKNSNTKFLWSCATCDKTNKTSIVKFLSRGERCQCCRKRKAGFNTALPASLYLYRWYGFGEEFYKLGITNKEVHERVAIQYRLGKLDFEPIDTWHFDSGQQAADLEKSILAQIETGICPKDWLPDGYTETFHVTHENLQKVYSTIREDTT